MLVYRAPTPQDAERLQALDAERQRRLDPAFNILSDVERAGRLRTSASALKFFERSEHSFVAEARDGEVLGAIFAQAVWQGDRPIVLVAALLLSPSAPEDVAAGLLHACVKSAYDSAVYEVLFPLLPELQAAARAEEARPLSFAACYLGSRAQTAPGKPLTTEVFHDPE